MQIDVYINKEAHFILDEDEWFGQANLTVVQIEVTFSKYKEDIKALAVIPTEIEKYKRGNLGPRGYHRVALSEKDEKKYLAQARVAIEKDEASNA